MAPAPRDAEDGPVGSAVDDACKHNMKYNVSSSGNSTGTPNTQPSGKRWFTGFI
jgi:hypothetical protein